jgi:GDP-L-fucose synthase
MDADTYRGGSRMQKDSLIYLAGHRGLVGSAIHRHLTAAGYTNIVTRTHAELDLIDQCATNAFFAEVRPEYVFLAASRVGGIGANTTYPAQFIYENLQVAANVIDAARVHGVTKLLNLGSSCIYPRLSPQPIAEECLLTGPLEPTNEPYAIAKIAAIKMCSAYNRQYGTDFVSLMPTNLYGPGDTYDLENGHVLPVLIAKFHMAKSSGSDHVVLWGDGSAKREFLYVDDLADACVTIMETRSAAEIGEFVNVGSAEELSIAELAGLVRHAVYADAPGRSCEIEWDTSKPNGMPRKLLDTSRMRALGWEPKVSLAEGIPLAYADYLARLAAGEDFSH